VDCDGQCGERGRTGVGGSLRSLRALHNWVEPLNPTLMKQPGDGWGATDDLFAGYAPGLGA
jgi:hypothetical protein